jgi:hypothetical protein
VITEEQAVNWYFIHLGTPLYFEAMRDTGVWPRDITVELIRDGLGRHVRWVISEGWWDA